MPQFAFAETEARGGYLTGQGLVSGGAEIYTQGASFREHSVTPLRYRLPSVASRQPVPGVGQPHSSEGSARRYSPVPWDEESVLWVKGRKTFDDTVGLPKKTAEPLAEVVGV